MRKNQGMEVSVIGIPLRGAIRAIRDAAWKQIRRGKGRSGEGAGKVKENGNASFFRSSSSHVHVPFAHWVNTVLSVVRSFLNLPSPPFLSFFLSAPCLCEPRSEDSIRFHSRPSSRSVFFPLVIGSPPTFNQRTCVYKACSLQ